MCSCPETWTSPDGRIRLWLGDCLDLLPTFVDGSIHAVVTDPPYGVNHSTHRDASRGASWRGTQILGDDSTASRDAVLEWAGPLPWATWGNYRTIPPAGFKAKIIWDKGPAFGAGDLTFPWKPSFEECWFSPGPWRSNYRGEGVWRGPCVVSWETRGRVHPHQKPVWLFERIIKALPAEFTIADPFLGSGTTMLACLRTGRRGLGIEKDPGYFAIAVKRIQAELARHPLFDGAAP